MTKSGKVKVELQIDLDRLDDEWAEQSNRRYEYGVELAEVRRRWEMSKNALSEVESEVARDIRQRPEIYGLTKITENAVKETMPLQDKVKEAKQQVVEARYEMDLAESAVIAFDHRKKALEKEVELFLANYFGKPRASGTSQEMVANMEMQRMAKRRNRKREKE